MRKTVIWNLALAAILGRALAATIVVGQAAPECLNATAPTIDAALALAHEGDEVRVCPGVYYAPAGGLLLEKTGLRVIASGPSDSVKLLPGKSGPPRYGFVVLAGHVRIEGFEITGFRDARGGAGILVGGRAPGDVWRHADAAEIEHNHIHDNSVGIYLWQSNANQIRHNVIHHSRLDGAGLGAGILGWGGRDASGHSGRSNLIVHNILHHNEGGAIRLGGPAGAKLDLSGTQIVSNRVTDNGAVAAGESPQMGFHLDSDYGVTIQGNVCLRNGGPPQQANGPVRTAESRIVRP